jgi:protein O-GlcNAc transferase
VPGARLLVRSASFQDPQAIEATRTRLFGYGLPADRVDLRMPEGGTAFFESYNEIDIILDTFPFNGGTTTCFATYMGVPVVTITGKSLISRMGLSMLTTLGVPELAVDSVQAYIERAVRLAQDPQAIRHFKHSARGLYATTALGNGTMFAREFEAACLDALQQLPLHRPQDSGLPVLPAHEIIRRAYSALGASQADAGQRIVAHCLRHYPDAGAAHILQAQLYVWGGAAQAGIAYLRDRVSTFSPADQSSAAISIARMQLLLGDRDGARETLNGIDQAQVLDAFDRQQIHLYEATFETQEPAHAAPAAAPSGRFHLLVPCDDLLRFEEIQAQLQRLCQLPTGWAWFFDRCSESGRIAAYERALAGGGSEDVLVIVQKHVEIHQPRFAHLILEALAQADCVASAGANRWVRMDWRADEFAHKAGGFMAPSSERDGLYELHLMGLQPNALVSGMAVLDGAVLAMRPGQGVPRPAFDPDLVGCETLLEERWTYQLGRQGGRLSVHRNLGVCLSSGVSLDSSNRSEARMKCATELAFQAFDHPKDDHSSLSTPVPSIHAAVATADAYFAGRFGRQSLPVA